MSLPGRIPPKDTAQPPHEGSALEDVARGRAERAAAGALRRGAASEGALRGEGGMVRHLEGGEKEGHLGG